MTNDPFDFFEDATPDYYIGQRVDVIRRGKRLQQRELALAAGMTQASLSRKINGSAPWGLIETVRVANALGVTISDLTEGVGRVLLPHLDSNQEPSDYASVQVTGLWHPSMGTNCVRCAGEGYTCPTDGQPTCPGEMCASCDYRWIEPADVVDLGAYRAARAS